MGNSLEIRFNVKLVLIFSVLLQWGLWANAQLVTTANANAADLVNTLVGAGIVTSNPVLTCPVDGAGVFVGSASNIGLPSGVILSSGNVDLAPGPNTLTGEGQDQFAPGDADLDGLITSGVTTNDACILEFDFQAICDTIEIAYVFGSEEYPEFVCDIYNDVFGFFISGPGIVGAQNIAIIPGTTTPVAINTINDGMSGGGAGCISTNTALYVDNTGGTTVEYDGFTIPLVAQTSVMACSTYHVKLAVADAGDGILDSGVFLEEDGIRCSGELVSVEATLGAWILEGCNTAELTFARFGDTTVSLTVGFSIGGTATPGVDYPALPGSVTFNPGEDTVQLFISAAVDGLVEPGENILIIVTDTLCNVVVNDTAELIIFDEIPVDLGPDTGMCTGNTLNMNVVPNNPAFYSYAWDPGPGLSSTTSATPTISLTTAGSNTYHITVTDTNGCTGIDSVVVSAGAAPTSSFSAANPLCAFSDGTISYTGTGSAAAVYTWNFAGGNVTSGTGQGPYSINWDTPGIYFMNLQVVENGCPSTITTVPVEVLPAPGLSYSITQPICNGEPSGEISVTAIGGVPPYSYEWNTLPGVSTPTITSLSAGTYIITVSDDGSCSGIDTITLTDPPLLIGSVTANEDDCSTLAGDGSATVTASGGVPPLAYAWSTIPPQATTTATGLLGGAYSVSVTDDRGCQLVISENVSLYPRPVVTAGPDVGFCEGEGGTEVTASGSGGAAPYYYNWWCAASGGACGLDTVFDNDPLANPTVTTDYYVQITDNNGCVSEIDTVTVEVIPKPQVNAGPDMYICPDSSPCATLLPVITASSGPFSYQWFPADGLNNDTILNPCARPENSTIYTLIVNDLFTGCESEATTLDTASTMTVYVNPRPLAQAGNDTDLCLGDTVMFNGIGSGAGPTYGYEWSPATGILTGPTDANATASPTVTTDYVLTVWSEGCASIGDTIRVNVHTLPTANPGNDHDICRGDTSILIGLADGDPSDVSYTYAWTPTDGVLGSSAIKDLSVSPDTSMTYYLTATSNWGCESAPAAVTVYLKPTPIADAGPDMVICEGDDILIDGGFYYDGTPPVPNPAGIIYSWSPTATLTNPTAWDPTASPTTTTTYTLTVQHNTCTTYDEVMISVIPEENATASADTQLICEGDTVQLNASGGITTPEFLWIPSDNVSDPTAADPLAWPDTTTTYSVVVTEAGCDDTAQVMIEVIPGPQVNYVSSLTDGCLDLTVNFLELTANALAYTWDFGDGSPVSNRENPVHTYTQSGTYTVSLTAYNVGGCVSTNSTLSIVVSDSALADFTSEPGFPADLKIPNTEVQFEDRSQNAVQWFWDFGNGKTSVDQNPSVRYTAEGEYFVKLLVWSEEGCYDEIEYGPFMVSRPELFIPNVFTPNADGVSDVFSVEYDGSQPYNLKIIDRWGVQIWESNDKTEGWNGTINGKKEANVGIYYYLLTIGDKTWSGDVTMMR